MTLADLPDEWSILFSGMADDALTADQEQRLTDLLQSDQDFRREYVRYCQLLTLLRWQLRSGPKSQPPAALSDRVPSTRRWMIRNVWTLLVIVSSAAIILIGFLRLVQIQLRDDFPGRVVNVVGQVALTHAKEPQVWIGPQELAKGPHGLRSGDHVRTDRVSSATLFLSDSTEIQMRPDTELTLSAGRETTIKQNLGKVLGRVTAQRPGRALIFVTPVAEIRVIGTELEVLATAPRTELFVNEGRVKVTRTADLISAEVAGSQFVAVEKTGDLTVIDIPSSPDQWIEDFEHGVPDGWKGRVLLGSLPQNSRSAAGAIAVADGTQTTHEVSSPTVVNGLFAWHPDSVLHVTFRVQPPEWFHIYLYAQSYRQPRSLLTYCCVKPELWLTSPGQWRTADIPLSEFRLMSYGHDEPGLGRMPMRIAFTGQGSESGIAIDRVSVDRSRVAR